MKIEHVALWTKNVELLKTFYEKYFKAQAGKKYVNLKTNFESYFLVFPGTGTRLELMHKPEVQANGNDALQEGWAHLAISVGSKEAVDELTARLKNDGFVVVSGPRTTGDGYYESCVLDPTGNHIEIVE